MDTRTFWMLIGTAHENSGGDMDKQLELLIDALSQLPDQELMGFDRLLWDMMAKAYRADLWEAAWVIGCGCGDDGFDDFRAWLISQGQNIYEEALRDPDSLADVVEKDRRFDTQDGRLATVASEAHERKTGHWKILVGYSAPLTLEGELGPETEVPPEKFPRIAAKLGDCDELV